MIRGLPGHVLTGVKGCTVTGRPLRVIGLM
jgi:hypothetical protein